MGEEAQGDQEAGLREGGRGEREREGRGRRGEEGGGGGGGGAVRQDLGTRSTSLVEWEEKHKETKKQG